MQAQQRQCLKPRSDGQNAEFLTERNARGLPSWLGRGPRAAAGLPGLLRGGVCLPRGRGRPTSQSAQAGTLQPRPPGSGSAGRACAHRRAGHYSRFGETLRPRGPGRVFVILTTSGWWGGSGQEESVCSRPPGRADALEAMACGPLGGPAVCTVLTQGHQWEHLGVGL